MMSSNSFILFLCKVTWACGYYGDTASGSSFVSSACATLAAPVGVAELIFMYAGGAKRLATKGPEGRLTAEIIFFQNNQHI